VASTTYGALMVSSSPSRPRTVTASTTSPVLWTATGTCSSRTVKRPEVTYGASISWIAATATLGSWHSGLTKPPPGLSSGSAAAAVVKG